MQQGYNIFIKWIFQITFYSAENTEPILRREDHLSRHKPRWPCLNSMRYIRLYSYVQKEGVAQWISLDNSFFIDVFRA